MTRMLWDEPLDDMEYRESPHRLGNTDPRGVPYNVYPTADVWICLMCLSQRHFARLVEVMEQPGLAQRYPNLPSRVAASAAIDEFVAAWIRALSTAEAERLLVEIDVPCAPVNEPWVTRTHPQSAFRQMLVPLRHDSGPDYLTPYNSARIPLVMSGCELGAAGTVEPLGASTAEILD